MVAGNPAGAPCSEDQPPCALCLPRLCECLATLSPLPMRHYVSVIVVSEALMKRPNVQPELQAAVIVMTFKATRHLKRIVMLTGGAWRGSCSVICNQRHGKAGA